MVKITTLAEVAKCIGAKLPNGVDPKLEITAPGSLENGTKGQLGFCNKQHIARLPATKCSVIITTPDALQQLAERGFELSKITTVLLCVDNPRLAFAKASQLFADSPFIPSGQPSSIHPNAAISPSAKTGNNVRIAEGVVIEEHADIADGCVIEANSVIAKNSRLGKNTFIGANVSCYPRVTIGEHCIIHSGTVIGADGFGFERDEKGKWQKIAQLGGVIIGDNVEIGANSAVDCGAIHPTTIADGVKIDNLVQIGHGTKIGSNTIICANCAIAGSVTIGESCVLAGCNAIKNGVTLADKTVLTGGTIITFNTTEEGKIYSGLIPAKPQHLWLQLLRVFSRQLRK